MFNTYENSTKQVLKFEECRFTASWGCSKGKPIAKINLGHVSCKFSGIGIPKGQCIF